MDDLISRQAAIKAIEDLQDCYNGFSDTYDKACIIGVIEEVPSIESVKHGRWIELEDDELIRGICSCCGWESLLYESDVVGMPFCPNCGAKMDEKENDK